MTGSLHWRVMKLPVVATNGVPYATVEDRQVLDVFTCARDAPRQARPVGSVTFGSGNSSSDAERRGFAGNLQSGNGNESLRVCFAFALGGAESPFERIAGLELEILEAA